MVAVSQSTVLNHPPERVFEAAADPMKQLEWDSAVMRSIEKLNPGPLAKGARYRGDFGRMGRNVEYEFEEYDPPRRFAHRTKSPMGILRHEFAFQSISGGTQLTQTGRVDPNLLGRLGAPLIKGAFRRRFRQISEELGQYLDARKAAST
jgi:uncharacterized protein YndB with AHSA1/START domain